MICVTDFSLWPGPRGPDHCPANPAEPPPEYKEVMAAMRIEDLAAQIKELERIKAAYPNSALKSTRSRA